MFSFLVVVAVPAGQPDGRACRRATAAVISAAQGQRSARRSRRRRPQRGQAAGDGEQAQAEPLGLPAAGVAGQGEHLGPGQQLAGQRDDLAPDLVLGDALQRQVPQPGVLGVPDAVLAPRPPPVPQLQVSELAFLRVGGEGGEPVPVDVGEPQLRAGCGRSLRTMTRIPAGQPPGPAGR